MSSFESYFRGSSISYRFFNFTQVETTAVMNLLNKAKFTDELKKGISYVQKRTGNIIEFDYTQLNNKKVMVYNKGKENNQSYVIKDDYKVFIWDKRMSVWGGTINNRLIKNLKEISSVNMKDIKLSKKKMDELYDKFENIRVLKLNDIDGPDISSYNLRGELTKKESWKEFHGRKDLEIAEISGTFKTKFGPVSMKINNLCGGQIYKPPFEINEEFVLWLKTELFG